MSNAKHYIEARDNQHEVQKYSTLVQSLVMATAILTVATSALAIYVALNVLTAGLASVVIAGCVVAGLAGSYGFFNSYNKLSAKRLADKQKTMLSKPNDVKQPALDSSFTQHAAA